MPLLPTDEQWRATIDGAPHLECEFWLPAGCTEGQARMQAWHIWTPARAAYSTVAQPVAAFGLRVELVADEAEARAAESFIPAMGIAA